MFAVMPKGGKYRAIKRELYSRGINDKELNGHSTRKSAQAMLDSDRFDGLRDKLYVGEWDWL